MAMAHRTSGWRGQKINTLHVSTLQGNYSHWIRRRTAMPEATFFCFFLSFSPFLPLYHEYNSSPPLRSYKRGGGGERKEEEDNNT
jgi:hypothetical protein